MRVIVTAALALAVGLFAGTTSASTIAVDLIGAAGSGAFNENGELEDLTGAEPIGVGALSTANAEVANLGGSGVGVGVAIPGFELVRSIGTTGGNSAIGFTTSTGTDLDPGPNPTNNTSASANNGNFVLTADTIDLGFTPLAGSTFTLSFDYAVDPGNTNAGPTDPDFTIDPTLSVGGVEIVPTTSVFSPLAAGHSVDADGLITLATDAVGGVITFTQTFELLADAADGLIEFSVEAGENIANNEQFDRIALDNIVLSGAIAVPEPAAAALCLLGLAGVASRRRR